MVQIMRTKAQQYIINQDLERNRKTAITRCVPNQTINQQITFASQTLFLCDTDTNDELRNASTRSLSN